MKFHIYHQGGDDEKLNNSELVNNTGTFDLTNYGVWNNTPQIRDGYTNQWAGFTIPAKPNTKYKLILRDNVTSLNANNSGYYYYAQTSGEAYDAATGTHTITQGVRPVENIVRSVDPETGYTIFEFTTSALTVYPVKSLNFTHGSSVYYGTDNPALGHLWSLFDSIYEETAAGWQDADIHEFVRTQPTAPYGSWTTGDVHEKDNGTWD